MMPAPVRWTILLTPFVLVAFFSMMLAVPATRDAGIWLLLENRPIEIGTFIFLMAAGLASLYLVWVARRRAQTVLTQLFYLAFGVGLILVAMEEIAWGQYWLGFGTPDVLADLNVKGEATLHNISGVDGRTEILRVLFGVGGLIGVWLRHLGRLPAISPPTVLWTWFAVITVLSVYDFANDIEPLVSQLDTLVEYIDELAELMIGIAALLYVVMKTRELSTTATEQAQAPG
jgi:hypothetical protein